MYYIIYQTTNLINGKIYVGKHQQETDPYIFDGYLGSGTQIQRAVNKYGTDNFERKTLFVYESLEECLNKEREIVNEEFVQRTDVYNMKTGGIGGWDHVTSNKELNEKRNQRSKERVAELNNAGKFNNFQKSEEWRKCVSERNRIHYLNKTGPFSPDVVRCYVVSIERNNINSARMKTELNPSISNWFCINPVTLERARFPKSKPIPDEWVTVAEWRDSKKKTHWYNDGSENYLLRVDDCRSASLVRGRLKK
jgi:hypothetical protein